MEKTKYELPLLSIAILDFQRPNELAKLLDSLDKHLKVPALRVYCHDGVAPDYATEHLKNGRIDTLITTSKNYGCGIQTRQLFQACLTKYVLYCQVDQFMVRDFTEGELIAYTDCLHNHSSIFYIDLANNQGQGRPSERASFYNRQSYLNIEGLDETVGGPGPLSHYKWTEQLLQEYMAKNYLNFATVYKLFQDNGRQSVRRNPDGSLWRHYPDTKQLWLESGPVWEKYVYPKFSDAEWQSVLETQSWPPGQIPEEEKNSSFHVWN